MQRASSPSSAAGLVLASPLPHTELKTDAPLDERMRAAGLDPGAASLIGDGLYARLRRGESRQRRPYTFEELCDLRRRSDERLSQIMREIAARVGPIELPRRQRRQRKAA